MFFGVTGLKRLKLVSGFGLAGFTLLAAVSAFPVIRDQMSGTPVDPEKVGTATMMASFLPLFMVGFCRSPWPTYEADADPNADLTFEENTNDRLPYLCAFWTLTIGATVDALLSKSSLAPSIVFALISCIGVFSLSRSPERLILSPRGILSSKSKAALISWRDIDSVSLSRRLGREFVSIKFVDHRQEGPAGSSLLLSPMFLRATPETMISAIERRRAAFSK